MPNFDRETRYLVLKRSDILRALTRDERLILDILDKKIDHHRDVRGAGILQCAVVESDWPEYEATWAAIEKRVSN